MPPPVRRRRATAVREAPTATSTVTAVLPSNQLRTLASTVGNRAVAMYAATMGDVRVAEHRSEVLARLRLDFGKAKRKNRAYAALPTPKAPGAIGWADRLETVPGAEHLAALWKAGRPDEFARAVAEVQIDLGFRERDVDGILGPSTWARMAGFGDAMATIEKTLLDAPVERCYEATRERMEKGYRQATGKPFKLREEASPTEFGRIIGSLTEEVSSVEEPYRGTGAAGALVYAGLGDFVTEADIWAGHLRPGATIQVFEHKQAYDLLRRAGNKTKNKLWNRLGDAGFFSGTSYVFVRYDTKRNDRMLVRHFSSVEWVSKRDWAVWIAANPKPLAGP